MDNFILKLEFLFFHITGHPKYFSENGDKLCFFLTAKLLQLRPFSREQLATVLARNVNHSGCSHQDSENGRRRSFGTACAEEVSFFRQ